MYRIFLFLLFVLLITTGGVFSVAAQNLPGNLRLPTGGGGQGKAGVMSGGAVQLDDSTKNIYGPTTTKYLLQEDILNNRDSTRYLVDTSQTNFHRWSYVDKSWGKLVDLGNLGTASRQLFFQPKQRVGADLGFHAYDAYMLKAEDIRYYDTKSPFTDMTYILGGRSQDILRFHFTQNINPRLNLGFGVQRFTSNKQYGTFSALGSEANLAKNWNFHFHGSYFSKGGKYLLLSHFRHMNHQVKEQGGVMPDSTELGIDWYKYDGNARLTDLTRSWERRNHYYLYHQYKLVNGFQVFHEAEYAKTINRYQDSDPLVGRSFGVYPQLKFDTTQIFQEIHYGIFENKVGLKGELSGFNYRATLRQRFYRMNGDVQRGNSEGNTYTTYKTPLKFENIIGLWLSYYLKDSTQHLTAEGEHLIGRDFKLKGELSTKWVRAGYQTIFWSPDLLMQNYVSNVLQWQNDFDLMGANTIYGSIPIKHRKFEFVPEIQYHLLTKYLYYDEQGSAKQADNVINLLRVGLNTRWESGRFNFAGMGYVSTTDHKNIIKMPGVFASGQITFDFTYAKAMDVQLGVAATYRSSYYADAYMPLTQQFYLNNDFLVDRYAVADVFANLRIKRVRLMLKMSHINQGLFVPGYYVTPGYLGLRRAFGLGVNWPLFD